MWTKYVQNTEFHNVIENIRKKKYDNLIVQLGLYMDNSGLTRCQGRLENGEICEEGRYPLLLLKCHRYTDLIIQCYHKKAVHTGCAQTLSSIRQKYWIPQGHRAVKCVLKKCTICRRHEGGPYKMPLMPPIPTYQYRHQHHLHTLEWITLDHCSERKGLKHRRSGFVCTHAWLIYQ